MVGVGQDFRLRRVFFRPVPLLVELFGERKRILHALDVAARAGIAVPVPGAADTAAGFIDPGMEAEAAKAVQHVQAGKARADNDGIIDRAGLRLVVTIGGAGHGAFPVLEVFCFGRRSRLSRSLTLEQPKARRWSIASVRSHPRLLRWPVMQAASVRQVMISPRIGNYTGGCERRFCGSREVFMEHPLRVDEFSPAERGVIARRWAGRRRCTGSIGNAIAAIAEPSGQRRALAQAVGRALRRLSGCRQHPHPAESGAARGLQDRTCGDRDGRLGPRQPSRLCGPLRRSLLRRLLAIRRRRDRRSRSRHHHGRQIGWPRDAQAPAFRCTRSTRRSPRKGWRCRPEAVRRSGYPAM